MKIKSLTIYCSSSEKIDKKFHKMAKETAEIISNYQIKVIYGGGNAGLMGEIARTLVNLRMDIIGIIPKFLIKKEKINFSLTNLKIVKDMKNSKLPKSSKIVNNTFCWVIWDHFEKTKEIQQNHWKVVCFLDLIEYQEL